MRLTSWLLFMMAATAEGQNPNAITTVAGQGTAGYSAASRAADALIETSYALAVDAFGNLYFADSWNHRIRKVAIDGTITTVAGNGTRGFSDGGATSSMLNYPRGVAVDSKGNIYISDSGNSRVRQVRPTGLITTIAGSGAAGFAGDGGSALGAQLREPRGIAVDKSGNVYIADSANYRVRRIGTNGTITTVAGIGRYGNDGDGQQASLARIGMPYGIAVDDAGNLFIADSYNHVVRRVSAAGVITTVAGTGILGNLGDGGNAKSAQLRNPRGVAVDVLGNLYIADTGNQRLRRVNSSSIITTVAGSNTAGFTGDGGPASAAQLNTPYGVATDPRGNVFVADLLNYRLRKARFEQMTDRPQITAGGVVSAADFVSPPSPGGLVSLFGKNFGYNPYAAAALPLDTNMGGTSVTVNGVPAPVIYASPTQINAQVPWATTPGTVNVKVNFGGVESDPASTQAPATAPMAFVTAERRGIIVNQDNAVNSPDRPAARGSVVVFYATGLGPVRSQPADGAGSGSSPLSTTIGATTVRFENVEGTVQFSGLTPGFVGLWQINVQIPDTAPTGSDVLTEIQVGSVISRTFTMSIREAP